MKAVTNALVGAIGGQVTAKMGKTISSSDAVDILSF